MSRIRADKIATKVGSDEIRVSQIKQSGTFAEGMTITKALHEISDENRVYKWTSDLPKLVSPGTNPTSDAGYVLVSDGGLRDDLSDLINSLPSKSFLDFVAKPKWTPYILRLGTVDFTSELQEASDYSSQNKVAICFPAGWASHTGFTIKKDTVLIGSGENHVVLENTSTNTKSISIEYVPSSLDWQNYWALIGMRITARNKGTSESQVGLDIDTGRHGFLSRLKIDNHYINFRERATWSCYFEYITLEQGFINFLVDIGPSTAGVPNTYVAFNNRYGDYNIDIRTRGLGATVFNGGCSESARIAGLRISGNENRTISFIGYNFEANAMDYISGDSTVANSGPECVSFRTCQFNSRTTNKPVSMQLYRGQSLQLDCCHFIGYTQVADLSSNFGSFLLQNNSGIAVFAQSTNANTPIPMSGTIFGQRSRYSNMSLNGFAFVQDSSTYKLLTSRRQTEQFDRFSIGADGKLFYHPFNSATHDTEFGRLAANVMGTGTDDGLRTGLFSTDGYPSASTYGQGTFIFDSVKNIPMYSRGNEWRDALGTVYTTQNVVGLTVPNNSVVPYNVVASGVQLGAMVQVSFSVSLEGVTMYAEVSLEGQITVYFTNVTGASKTVNGTIYLAIRRRD